MKGYISQSKHNYTPTSKAEPDDIISYHFDKFHSDCCPSYNFYNLRVCIRVERDYRTSICSHGRKLRLHDIRTI